MNTVYVDNAATTRLCKPAIDAMTAAFEIYGNPSSLHHIGAQAFKSLEHSREAIASAIGCEPKELYFTGGGSEADNWAIKSTAALMAKKGKKKIISTNIEHHAVLHTLERLEKEGFTVVLLPVSNEGYITAEQVKDAIDDNTALVTVMYANNEIGTIQPIEEIAEVCKKANVYFHTDAVQAVGHLPIDVKAQSIDMLSMAAHKFGGPKGIGALYVRKGIVLNNLIDGGGQERGKRGGTENVVSAAGMAAALQDSLLNLEAKNARLVEMRDSLIQKVLKIERSRLNGGNNRLPGNASFCFEGIEGESLLLSLDMYGICGSSGSACTSGSLDPSHVLLAIGLPHEIAHGSLRVSIDTENTREEMDFIAEKLIEIVAKLRDMSPVWEKIIKENK